MSITSERDEKNGGSENEFGGKGKESERTSH
jgi:hypothetical protein